MVLKIILKSQLRSKDSAFLASNEGRTNRLDCDEHGAAVEQNNKGRYSWVVDV